MHSIPKLIHYNGDTSKKWYLDYKVWDPNQNKYIRKRFYAINTEPTKEKRYHEAEEAKKQLIKQLKEGYQIPIAAGPSGINIKTITFLEAIDYVIAKKRNTLRPHTIKDYNVLRKLIAQWLNFQKTPQLKLVEFKGYNVFDLFDYMNDERKYRAATFNKHRGYVATILNFYANRFEDFKKVEIVKLIPKRRVEEGLKHKPYTKEQIDLIKQKVKELYPNTQLLLFIQSLYYLCTRPWSENLLIKIGDIKKDHIVIEAGTAKNKKTESIDIAEDFEKIIQQHKLRSYPKDYYLFSTTHAPGPHKVTYSMFYDKHKRILKQVGLFGKGYDTYGYKHTAVINLVNSGADLKDIQKHCRHHSITMTEKYFRDLHLIREAKTVDKYEKF